MSRPAIVDFLVPMTPKGAVDPDTVPARLRTPSILNQLSSDELVARMDHFGIGQSIIPARRYGPHWGLDYAKLRDFVAEKPGRLFAVAGIDPLERMPGVRRLEEAVRDWGFIGAHTYSSWSDTPADDRLYYPYYAKCEELGVPVQIECMNAKTMISHGHPAYIERVAVDFPGLKIVATHTGYPWNRELVAVAEFRSNVWIGCDGFPPVLWPEDLLNFIKGETFRGVRLSLENSGFGGASPTSDRCLFGSNYLSIHLETALPEIEKLGLDDNLWAKLMATNARDLYQLPEFEFDQAT